MKKLKNLYLLIGIITTTLAVSQTKNLEKMNLQNLHNDSTAVQTNMLFPATEGKVIALQILKGKQLEEHITKVPAILICVIGNAVYQDEKGNKITLLTGDYVKIEPNVKHSVTGIENSNLLLIK